MRFLIACDPARFKQILDAYSNKHKSKGWYKIDGATANKIIELLRGDTEAKKEPESKKK